MNVQSPTEKLGFLNLLIFFLSVYVLTALVVSTFVKLPPNISLLLDYIDIGICCIFLFEFFYRLIKAPNKLEFMKWGWIDLLASIPTLDFLRAGRLFRLVRLLRVLRAFRSMKYIVNHVLHNRAQGTFSAVTVIAVLMIIFSSIAILQVEDDPASNIKTPEDAIWWAFVTITTVGYGDKFPVTTEGRILAAFLMIVGVGLFGIFTGYVATWFIDEKKEKEAE